MDVKLERFLKKIEFDITDDFKALKIMKVKVDENLSEWNIELEANTLIDLKLLSKLIKRCEKGLEDVEKINLFFRYNEISNTSLKEELDKLFIDALVENPSLGALSTSDYRIEEFDIVFEVSNEMEKNTLKRLTKAWLNLLNKAGITGYEVTININEDKRRSVKEELASVKQEEVLVIKEPAFEPDIIFGREIKGKVTEIRNVLGPENNVTFEAFVFGYEVISTKKENLKIVTIKISDKTDSMIGKIFTRNQEELDALNKIKQNKWYRFRGNIKDDSFSKDIVMNITDIMSIETKDTSRTDDALEKRCELHAHTMMSQMDGVADVQKLIDAAKKFGHKALAITDHNVAQAFPNAFNYWGKGDVKLIYGVEMNVVDDNVTIVLNPNDTKLIGETYVIFDVETTGFNPTNGDEMIEIGAVKICNGEILETFQEFIKPTKKLPPKITELTGITEAMLKNADTEENVTRRFIEWYEDLPLVAHNARFDISFLNSAIKKYDLKPFTNPLLDTMEISRIVSPEEKRHNLSALVKRYNIEFDEGSHHRADYDAKGTALAFDKMINILKRHNIHTINDLQNSVNIDEIIKFARPFHLNILTATQVGLKNLFKIISLAGTKYLNKTPRIPKSELVKYREGLLFGSGCVNGEIFNESRKKDDDELAHLMEFYDYIEVQPPSICTYLIDTEEFTNMFELENNIKKIIRVAELAKKPVVATGDVHQINPEDNIYREIIVNQKSPSVGIHPLNKSRIRKIPSMHLRTTGEMLEDFAFLGNAEKVKEIVVTNPNKIADMIENIEVIRNPKAPFSPKIENSDKIVTDMVYDTARGLYGENLPELVETRVKQELAGIIGGGFDVIYLISQKLVKKSNDDGYLVGSRGSVGSSFVATMMGITEVNPLPAHYLCPKCKYSEFNNEDGLPYGKEYSSGYDLPTKACPKCHENLGKEGQDMPFATFLGFNADKVPDIDLNFSGEYQANAHEYTKVLFGEENVYRSGTVGTVADKTAYGFVKGYCEDKNITIRTAEIERLVMGCTGVKRTTGQHPGGIIVIPEYMDVFDFCPIAYPADDISSAWKTTTFEYHSLESNLLKLDILGHDDPTMLRMLSDLSGIDVTTLPMDDEKIYSLLRGPEALGVSAEQINCPTGTLGLPELGTNFVIKMLSETKPKNFGELMKISGLSHGTDVWAGNASELIRQNIVPFKDVIGCRDDIMVTLINYGLEPIVAFKIMEAVRKGKQLKDMEQWNQWVKQMEEKNVPSWYIDSLKKIKYMFPKAHACAYVTSAVRVAWFKLYKPLMYYAAYFSVRAKDFDVECMIKGIGAVKDKIAEIQEKGYNATNKEVDVLDTLNICLEMLSRGFNFENIDVVKSDGRKFLINEETNSLIIPFRALDGLGDNVANKVVEEREKSPFISIEDVQMRGKVNGTTIDKMRTLGVFKNLPESSQLSLF